MAEVDIQIKDGKSHYVVGDTISGVAEVTIPEELSITENVIISYICAGEVKWVEEYGSGQTYHGDTIYHEESLQFSEPGIPVVRQIEDNETFELPFSFAIPKEKNLPSSFVSTRGYIKHIIQVLVKESNQEIAFSKEITVQAPFDNNLKISVGGSAEKVVLFHSGTVSMQASIERKGFAAGETIPVHVTVDNKINAVVVPRISLQQIQIYMVGNRHKTLESTIAEELHANLEISPISQEDLTLEVKIPHNEWLSNKSSLISVKYFVIVSLVIPHSLELHVNLPIVITTKNVIDELLG